MGNRGTIAAPISHFARGSHEEPAIAPKPGQRSPPHETYEEVARPRRSCHADDHRLDG